MAKMLALNLEKVKKIYRVKSRETVLVITNLIPILGVVFLQWRVFDIFALYWLENVIIGLINIGKIIVCNPESQYKKLQAYYISWLKWLSSPVFFHLSKVPVTLFFIFHYGVFCWIHGFALIALFRATGASGGLMTVHEIFLSRPFVYYALVFVVGHLYYFIFDFIKSKEYKTISLNTAMSLPYTRVFVLHVAILVGGILFTSTGSSVAFLPLLILFKLILERHFFRSHQQKLREDSGKT